MFVIECSIGQALAPWETVQCHFTFPLAWPQCPSCALHSLVFLSSLAFRCSLLDEFLFTCQSSPTGSSPSEILQESVDPLHFHLGPLRFYNTDDS